MADGDKDRPQITQSSNSNEPSPQGEHRFPWEGPSQNPLPPAPPVIPINQEANRPAEEPLIFVPVPSGIDPNSPALSILAASAAAGRKAYDAAQRGQTAAPSKATGISRAPPPPPSMSGSSSGYRTGDDPSLREAIRKVADAIGSRQSEKPPPPPEPPVHGPEPSPERKFWSYIDKAVLSLFELLALMFGLPFGDDLFHERPVTNLHMVYLGIGVLFAIGGPMFPLVRTINWIPKWVTTSVSAAARDARIWIVVLLIFFLYGVAPDIYRRATTPVALTGAPLIAKNATMFPPNLGRASWFTIFFGLTKPGETLLLPKWFVIVTSPPENAEAEGELNTIFNLASTVSGTLRPAGLPDYSRDLDAPKLEGKALRGITVHGRNPAADLIAETLQNCFLILRTAEVPAGLFDYYHRQSPAVFPEDKFVWLEIGNGSPWKGNCRG
jgi:hypothetical protein